MVLNFGVRCWDLLNGVELGVWGRILVYGVEFWCTALNFGVWCSILVKGVKFWHMVLVFGGQR